MRDPIIIAIVMTSAGIWIFPENWGFSKSLLLIKIAFLIEYFALSTFSSGSYFMLRYASFSKVRGFSGSLK